MNHAFASALAPTDSYNEQALDAAIRFLGQDPSGDLRCVYCGAEASTWDHLVGLVKNRELRGFGHQIGNLVPCCSPCNSKKGGKDWQQFIDETAADEGERARLLATLSGYNERFAHEIDLDAAKVALPEEWARYTELRDEIVALMNEADAIAAKLRPHLVKGGIHSTETATSGSIGAVVGESNEGEPY